MTTQEKYKQLQKKLHSYAKIFNKVKPNHKHEIKINIEPAYQTPEGTEYNTSMEATRGNNDVLISLKFIERDQHPNTLEVYYCEYSPLGDARNEQGAVYEQNKYRKFIKTIEFKGNTTIMFDDEVSHREITQQLENFMLQNLKPEYTSHLDKQAATV